ncbi:GGDEF domain-containing protein [Kibdelosporangium lantanae]|uniref:GGDEF domain-containing protein n=1 Tax=Kibdelosporangium lantanae TaxID=1497396 RepID=A0ABW3M560_9PSEU
MAADGLQMTSSRLLLARSWAIWQTAKPVLVGYVLAVDLLAVLGVTATLVLRPIGPVDPVPLILLVACAILYTELSLPIAKLQDGCQGSLNSVWIVAAVLLLHPALAAVVVLVACFTTWLRARPKGLYRKAFATSATILSGLAAASFLHLVNVRPVVEMPKNTATFAALIGAAVIFLAVNTILSATFRLLSGSNRKIRQALTQDYALEAAAAALGILLSWALVDWPITVLLIMGIMLVLHRSALIRQLRDQARADPKTGLLNSATWFKDAAAQLDRSKRSTALLMLDLDHFKTINDRHGHLVGDKHLRGVADVLRSEVRSTDLVGRFGGEEFVILLPQTAQQDAMAIAERIRRRVATVTVEGVDAVTVSVGVAAHPDHGETLEEVVSAADNALLAAKTAGRNRTLLFPC